MKYQALVIIGVGLILVGYGLMKTGGQVTHVTCLRTESAFLPVCELRETFMGWFPSRPAETVTEVTALSKEGKSKAQYFLVQRLENRKLAPVDLNKVVMDGRGADQEPMASLARLADFFKTPDTASVQVTLTNEAGSVTWGLLLFLMGIGLVLQQRISFEAKKPKQTDTL